MTILSTQQIETFWRDGAVVVPGAVSEGQLDKLKADMAGWVEESRSHGHAYGQTLDGRPRFDLEPGHSRKVPALRRVASPTEVSPAYHDVAFNAKLADMVADLIGPAIRFHHAKVNSKLPGSATVVKWHQDFPFDPHSNDDVITALLFVDDVTPDNGPLMISPGSHKGPLYTLWHDGKFTGAVSEDLAARFERDAVACHGPAGSACLMHSRVAHASSHNRSDGPRTLFIVTYAAADAQPIGPIAVPSVHAGAMVRGEDTRHIRSIAFDMPLPEIPKGASFFVQQAGGE